jgi:dTDP-4-dehydrorhamnose reductase
MMRGRSILLTGGTGYVGTYLARHLSDVHRVQLLDGDVTAPDLRLPEVDVVIHLAGKLNSFAGSAAEIERINFGGTVNLAERCGPQVHFVFLSTDQVFASDPSHVYTEHDATAPETPYGWSKVMAEELLLGTLNNVTVLRTAVLYGYSHPRRRNTVEFIESKLRAGEPVELFNDVFGCATFIGDLAACVERTVADRIVGIHHACGTQLLSRCDIGAALCAARGYAPGLVRAVPRPASSNLPRCLHLRPAPTFADLLSTRLDDWLAGTVAGSRDAFDAGAQMASP